MNGTNGDCTGDNLLVSFVALVYTLCLGASVAILCRRGGLALTTGVDAYLLLTCPRREIDRIAILHGRLYDILIKLLAG